MRTALLAPERVRALLLFDTESGVLTPAEAEQYDQLFSAIAEKGPVAELGVPLATQMIGECSTAHDWVQVWARRWETSGFPLGGPVDCLVGREDITPRLSEITAPALVVRGENDHSIPAERQERMHSALLNATQFHVVPGAGHSPPLTHPRETNALIEDFLAGLPSAD